MPVQFGDAKVRPETYYYHPDHLGSTSWVTDQNGRVHEHVEYFPYGEVWREPKSDRDGAGVKGQRFLFSGKELDEETGLYYFGARYSDPVRTRWASPDPADRLNAKEGTKPLNAYQSVLWNPLRVVDPDGRRDERVKSADVPRASEGPWQERRPVASPQPPVAPSGASGRPGFGVRDVMALVGIANAVVNHVASHPQEIAAWVWAGANARAGGKVDIVNGVLEVSDAPLQRSWGGPGSAITLGSAVVYANSPLETSESGVTTRAHEQQHVTQSQYLGPLYLPLAGTSLLTGYIFDGDTHGPHSFMESGPQSNPPRPTPWR
ncbi:MAG TPA: RHS repeat-associated core domain-containing protein [Anaeromyxobacteraceae bacterium]|nr:RHS repeat-associated core domain-containing protein [Anaeromyxobacteraceae bacterium]